MSVQLIIYLISPENSIDQCVNRFLLDTLIYNIYL